MKSCRCAQCNVSSARYAWGFALLARDGWAVSEGSDIAGSIEGAWLCPACTRRYSLLQPGLAKTATPPPPRARSRSRGFLRILLVDDEDALRRCTERTLAEFEVVCASSGAEALGILAKDSDFDAILSDVLMPQMSGYELFARCYREYPRLAQRFVFASGSPESARVELQRVVDELGAPHPILIAKPCPREGLLLALFAAAAHVEPVSGTFSIVEGEPVEVAKYRG
ncbi:MAG TPA: response regulator [Polyangiaceae bacterium]|nr:response regulator [Polyangiaceae bacterium]